MEERSLYIKTFGCQMNAYDSERMKGLLLSQGYRNEEDIRKADVILINTCSIRDKSEHKVLSLLGQLKPLKTRFPQKILGITGCVGQRMGRSLLQRVPHLDLVLGPDQIDEVPLLISKAMEKGERIVATRLDESGRKYSQPALSNGKVSEFLTIMKGCDHFCSYCIVPFVRGREKSRSIAEILADVKTMVALGTKEITFLGQNINTYGKGGPERLSQLIEGANQIEGLQRIRYVTSHPHDLGNDLIEQFGRIEKLCPALHLPFQSGSNRVLKRMIRLYDRESYLNRIERLRMACPKIALSTDVIVGFPGETDEDFAQTLSLLEQVRFSGAFLFKYSPRPGTKAFALHDDVVEKIKEVRLEEAHKVAFSHIEKENGAFIGKKVSCLVESLDKKGRHFFGRTPHNKIVHVLDARPHHVGQSLDVTITSANGSCLKGLYEPQRTVHENNGSFISASA